MLALTTHLPTLFAQIAGRWTFGELAIAVIVIIAIVAIVYIFIKQSGIPVPPWIWNIAWIVAAALLAIFAIRLLLAV